MLTLIQGGKTPEDNYTLKRTEKYYVVVDSLSRYATTQFNLNPQQLKSYMTEIVGQLEIIQNDYFLMGIEAGIKFVQEHGEVGGTNG